mmetsp:Transcript_27582/g.64746  ORF Transcript_27582/g.64746 Transcript_27582/m.64746 type:complete len:287 (+) Transcript_27582:2495-3355(+)
MGQDTEFVSSLRILGVALFVRLDLQEGSSFQIDVVDLDIGNCRLESTRPISEAVRAVHQSLFVKPVEGLHNGLRQHLIHGEVFPRPVDTRSEVPQLSGDAVSVLVLPLPDLFHEFLSSQVVPGLVLDLHQHFLDNALCGNSSVVRSGHVQCGVPLHAVPPGQCILDSGCQTVSKMQATGYVGRWDDHDKFLVGGFSHSGFRVSLVKAGSFPPVLPSGFDGFRVVGVCKWNLGHVLLFSLGSGVDEGFLRFDFLLLSFFFLSGPPLWFLLLLFLSLALGQFFQLVLR